MERIELKDFTRYKFLSGIEYSPQGKNACFIVHGANVEDNKYDSNLWLLGENNQLTQLTTQLQERSFIWKKDGEQILFSSMRDGKDQEKAKNGEVFTQFYTISINGGEAKKAFRINKRVTSILEVDTDTYLFTAIFDPSMEELEGLEESEKQKELKRRKEELDYEVLDEIPFWSNGGGFTNKKRNRLYLYNATNQQWEALSDEFTNVSSVRMNDQGTKAVFIGSTFNNKMELENTIYIYDIKNKIIDKINFLPTILHSDVELLEENQLIYVGKDKGTYGLNENPKIYLANLDNKTVKCLTPEFDLSVTNSVGTDCRYGITPTEIIKKQGQYLYFVTTEGSDANLNRIDVQGNIEKLTTEKGTVDSFAVKGDEVLFIGLREQKLQELYRLNNSKEEEISQFNQWVIKEKSIIKPDIITVETEVGVNIDGWIMKPANFEKDKKYPAILNIHGGPKTVYGDVYYHEMQYWANEGYVVFFCNPRGSDGKGNSFADIRGKYGTIDYNDIMKFTDGIIEKYDFIDIERIGVTGGSYGGFMTNWIIGHTHRFKAAATQRSIANWTSFFGTTDIGYFFAGDQIAATPWNNYEKLWEHSPLKYADQVKTPTLIIHSDEDYRCWVVEGMQMFTALKYHGVPSRMCMFKGENHELSRSGKPKHRIRRLEEITNWFNKYLKEEN